MSHSAIVAEVTNIHSLVPTAAGIWFETDSPGPLSPVLMFLSWEQLDELLSHRPKETP
jgi:hypothetical protein